MDDNTTAVVIVAVVMLTGFAIVRFVFGALGLRRGPQGDPAQTQALSAVAERMERRIESLEMLLDSELPGWRSRSRTP